VNVVTNDSLSRGEASHCGSRLAWIGSHSWDSGRLIVAAAALTQTVGKLTVGSLVPMVTMTLSVQKSCGAGIDRSCSCLLFADGHSDTVGCRWSP
jgi:hypothetical protein